MTDDRLPVAAVITHWRKNSHADVLLSRILEPEAWGHTTPFRLRLASVYADQFPASDLARPYCEKHNVPIARTISEAIKTRVDGQPVAGVLLIGEHGSYATNARGQIMYPRRRLFEAIVDALRVEGRRVPVFCDKHLSYDWLFARWMYDLARHESIPLLAGSSLPVGWRVPERNLPLNTTLSSAFAVGYSDLEAYGFHALETLQCQAERRAGGETGVASVRCVTGDEVIARLKSDQPDGRLLETLIQTRRQALPEATKDYSPRRNDALFLIEYTDGLKATVAMLDSLAPCFGFCGQREGDSGPESFTIELEEAAPFGHFGHLLRAIESMVHRGEAPYPIERTLLTTGMLAALMQSHAEGGTAIRTPHLAELGYQPADWPFAPGRPFTPA